LSFYPIEDFKNQFEQTELEGNMDIKKDWVREQGIKCVVWDLDNTLWDGTIMIDDRVSLRNNVRSIIRALDDRGILQSIASKNDYACAMEKLQEFNLDEYFLFPQIGWHSKALSMQTIAESINIGLDTIAFIDDQPFEREEVNFSHPEVLCIDATDIDKMLDMSEMNPRFITLDSKMRRQMYLNDQERNNVEENFVGPKEEFLASLQMELSIFPAKEEDLKRAEELTVRTHQLNATGYTYSYDELNYFRLSDQHQLFMARLKDKYGTYGHIGLSLIECSPDLWTIKLLLMSCRVMSRGIGTIMLSHIMQMAKQQDVRLQAEFVPNDRNRMMDITYRFAGFDEVDEIDGRIIIGNELSKITPFPDYVKVNVL
jgi:FkbH-like protein